MISIKKIIKRWKAIKSILNAEEYFVTVANSKNRFGQKEIHGPIVYEYMNNTDRNLFYVFVKDYIDNELIK